MKFITLAFALVAFMALPVVVKAEDHHHDAKEAAVKTVPVVEGSIYMLQAGGGNIGVLIGDQGTFVIDNDVPGKGGAVIEAVKALSDKPIKILANTHWHFDHAGNNADFVEQNTVIIAHDNVRKRLEAGQTIPALDKTIEPAAAEALPVLTYDQGPSIHLNGQHANVVHVHAAHTDGDSYIVWPDANVIHAGDLFFNGFYPFIDASSGGKIDGMIAAAKQILDVADENTKIIPGHGPLATKADLQAFHDMLSGVALSAKAAKTEGKTAEEWKATKPLADIEPEWGDGFLSSDQFADIVWSTL